MDRKNALIEAIRRVQKETEDFAATVPVTKRQMTGTLERWSAKDLLAHVGFWNERLWRRLSGETVAEIDDSNDENARVFSRHQASDWEEVLATARAATEGIVEALKRLPEETLASTQALGWPEEEPVWRRIASTAVIHPLSHYSEHAEAHGDQAESLRLHREAAGYLAPLDDGDDWQGVLHYNVACGLALNGATAEAIARLSQALALNPGLRAWSLEDSDLDSLRGEPAYQALYGESMP